MLQSSRYAKPEKFPDRRHLAEEARHALTSLCVSVKAISGPRIRHEERFSIFVPIAEWLHKTWTSPSLCSGTSRGRGEEQFQISQGDESWLT